MSETESLLVKYNKLRGQKKLPPVHTWEGSQDDLKDAIDQIEAMVKANGNDDKTTTQAAPMKKKAKAAKKKPEAPAAKKVGVSLSDICSELKMDPRKARIKLRAAYKKAGHKLPDPVGDVWTFKSTDVKAIKTLLTSKE